MPDVGSGLRDDCGDASNSHHKELAMKHPFSILAALAFAAGTTMLGATAASAMPPDEPGPGVTATVPPGPPNYPEYPVQPPVDGTTTAITAVDDTGTEALQAGASAIGGAAIALTAMWFVQRRRVHTA